MRARSYFLWIYALTLTLPTLAAAQTPAPESFLVRRTAHVDDGVTGFQTNVDYVIFRDGLLISTQRSAGQNDPDSSPGHGGSRPKSATDAFPEPLRYRKQSLLVSRLPGARRSFCLSGNLVRKNRNQPGD